MRTFFLGLALAAYASPAISIGCDAREYGQYKDQARTASGQMSMADEYCRFEIRRKASSDLAALAAQHRQMRDLAQATAEERGCMAEMQKIRDALSASNATKAWGVMASCVK